MKTQRYSLQKFTKFVYTRYQTRIFCKFDQVQNKENNEKTPNIEKELKRVSTL